MGPWTSYWTFLYISFILAEIKSLVLLFQIYIHLLIWICYILLPCMWQSWNVRHMTPTWTVAHGAEILMHLHGGNTAQGNIKSAGCGGEMTWAGGWLVKQRNGRGVQGLRSSTLKVRSHKCYIYMILMKSETIIRYFLTTQGFVIVSDKTHGWHHIFQFLSRC